MSVSLISERNVKGWHRRKWIDGTIQYAHMPLLDDSFAGDEIFVVVERIIDHPTRHRWHLVDRREGIPGANDAPEVPIVAGPFPTLKAAQTAYLLMKDSITPLTDSEKEQYENEP
jgi:hypothetical protein